MYKLIIILVLLVYVLNKVTMLFFRPTGQSNQQPNFRAPRDGDIRTDNAPKKDVRKGGLKGGEYVDFEEIK